MCDAGPSLLPGKVELYLTRGHPLLFHFIGGVWLKIFGKSFVSYHALPLFISVFSLSSGFYIIKTVLNPKVAFYSMSLLMCQLIFIAQSSMVLPEVLVMSLSFLTLFAFAKKNWTLYVLSGLLLLLTKESGVVCILACNVLAFAKVIFRKETVGYLIRSIIPYLSMLLFFGIQKWTYGWFFYPEHVSMMEFTPNLVLAKLESIGKDLFINQNRAWLFGIIFLSVMLSFEQMQRIKLNNFQKDFFLLGSIFTLGYILFSSLNFLTSRYLIVLFPFIIMGGVMVLFWSMEGLGKLAHVILWSLLIMFVCNHNERFPAKDINLSYLEYCPTQSKLVSYLEENNHYQDYIYTDFLNLSALQEPYAGYRKTSDIFIHLNKWDEQPSPYLKIINSVESGHEKSSLDDNPKAKLIQHFGDQNIWFRLYQIYR